MLMVDVPALMVNKPGSPAAFQLPDTLMVEEPKFSTRTAELLHPACELNEPHVHVVPLVFKVPFRNSIPLKLRFAPKLTNAPNPFIFVHELVPLEVGRNVTVAPAVIFKSEFIVAKALNVMFAAPLTSICCIVMLFVKFNVAAWFTVMFPVFHAAVFDQVPVPVKNTGPKFLPPEFIVLVPVPMKYTFIEVVQVPCVLTIARFP